MPGALITTRAAPRKRVSVVSLSEARTGFLQPTWTCGILSLRSRYLKLLDHFQGGHSELSRNP